METVRVILQGGQVNVKDYNYFIYVNCGTTGPAPTNYPWTLDYTSRMDDKVKMVGLSHNRHSGQPHIQSMVYALDRVGLELIQEQGAVYDCRGQLHPRDNIISRYEIGMSRILLDAGYAIRSILRNTTIQNWHDPCEGEDMWFKSRLKEFTGLGRVPHLNETIFFKTSRVLPEEIANKIKYTRHVHW